MFIVAGGNPQLLITALLKIVRKFLIQNEKVHLQKGWFGTPT